MGSSVHVRATIGAEQYAFPVSCVREITPVGEVTPLPGADPAVLGLRNLRGQVLPVIDAAILLEVESGGRGSQLLVVEEGRRRGCLAVDSVVDVGDLPPPDETSVESDLLSGAVLVAGELVGVVDVAALLDRLDPEAGR